MGRDDIEVVGRDAIRKMKTCEFRYVPMESWRVELVGEDGCVPFKEPVKLFLKKEPDHEFWEVL